MDPSRCLSELAEVDTIFHQQIEQLKQRVVEDLSRRSHVTKMMDPGLYPMLLIQIACRRERALVP